MLKQKKIVRIVRALADGLGRTMTRMEGDDNTKASIANLIVLNINMCVYALEYAGNKWQQRSKQIDGH